VAKALASAADEVVVDLEDAVPPGDKGAARQAVGNLAKRAGRGTTAVRVNAWGSAWLEEDLAACVQAPGVSSIVIPKADDVHHLAALAQLLDQLEKASRRRRPLEIQILVENARGLSAIEQLCQATPRVCAVIIGYADLAADLGRDAAPTDPVWLVVQERVLLAARLAGIAAVDGPAMSVADGQPFQDAKRRIARLGFDGTWVIHPAQVTTATALFTPPPQAVERAQRVISALAGATGAQVLDGELIDGAHLRAAQRLLARAGLAAR
jgi:citrate lyase subunit beta/citryl-CoA lyase